MPLVVRGLDLFRQEKKTWRFAASVNVRSASEPLSANPSVPVALPDGFQLDDDGLELRISWRWFSWYAMRGIIFAAIFSVPVGFVLYAYVNSPDKSWPAPVLAITLLLALPPAVTIYGLLAYILNSTTIRVDATRVSVRHSPLPWLGAKHVSTADIDGVVSEIEINDSSDSSDGTIFQPREVFAVKLMLKSGKTRRLVTGLRSPDQALFIEQQIRKALSS
jgi:hypothetical protein